MVASGLLPRTACSLPRRTISSAFDHSERLLSATCTLIPCDLSQERNREHQSVIHVCNDEYLQKWQQIPRTGSYTPPLPLLSHRLSCSACTLSLATAIARFPSLSSSHVSSSSSDPAAVTPARK